MAMLRRHANGNHRFLRVDLMEIIPHLAQGAVGIAGQPENARLGPLHSLGQPAAMFVPSDRLRRKRRRSRLGIVRPIEEQSSVIVRHRQETYRSIDKNAMHAPGAKAIDKLRAALRHLPASLKIVDERGQRAGQRRRRDLVSPAEILRRANAGQARRQCNLVVGRHDDQGRDSQHRQLPAGRAGRGHRQVAPLHFTRHALRVDDQLAIDSEFVALTA